MAFAEFERLVMDLLGTGAMRDDTASDLHRFLAEARAGQLHPDDLAYVQALHSRVAGAKPNAGGGTSTKPEGRQQTDPLAEAIKELRAAQATIAALQHKAATAQRAIASLEQQLVATRQGGGADDRKFREVKKRFAKRYHPNSVGSSGMEAIIRAEIFKEFWADFEDVEKS